MNAPVRKATEIAARAAELVGGDRDRQHGQKRDNFSRIASVWNGYMAARREPASPLDALDVGHMMVLMKVARTQSGAVNVDDYVDAAGYAACAGEIALDDADAAARDAVEGVEINQQANSWWRNATYEAYEAGRPLQAGDLVRCVRDASSKGALHEGVCYFVEAVNASNGYVRLAGLPVPLFFTGFWNPERFVRA